MRLLARLSYSALTELALEVVAALSREGLGVLLEENRRRNLPGSAGLNNLLLVEQTVVDRRAPVDRPLAIRSRVRRAEVRSRALVSADRPNLDIRIFRARALAAGHLRAGRALLSQQASAEARRILERPLAVTLRNTTETSVGHLVEVEADLSRRGVAIVDAIEEGELRLSRNGLRLRVVVPHDELGSGPVVALATTLTAQHGLFTSRAIDEARETLDGRLTEASLVKATRGLGIVVADRASVRGLQIDLDLITERAGLRAGIDRLALVAVSRESRASHHGGRNNHEFLHFVCSFFFSPYAFSKRSVGVQRG